eukprot:7027437-Alexandrium_andersonii.AAC.1
MLAALQQGDALSLSALAADACLGGTRIKEEDDVEEADPEGMAEPVGSGTPSAPTSTDPLSS